MSQPVFRSLRLRLLATTLPVMLLSVILVFVLSIWSTYQMAELNVQQRLQAMASNLATNLARPLYTYNDADMERALAVVSILPELVHCVVYDNNGSRMAQVQQAPDQLDQYVSIRVPVIYHSDMKDPQKVEEKVGELELVVNRDVLHQALLSQILTGIVLILLLSLSLTLVLAYSFKKTIGAPLAQLLEVLTTTRTTGKKNLVAWYSNDELGIVVNAYNEVVLLQAATERKLQDARIQAEASAEYQSSFLANMSHEIRTPLNALMGFTDVLQQTTLNDNQQGYLQRVSSAAANLLTIVNDILDLAKIEAGKLQLEQQPFELHSLSGQLVDLLSQKAMAKKLELFISCHQPPRQVLIGDALRLHQILLNLANNALKFTDQGEVEVAITQQDQTADRSLLSFSVRDTGIGLTEAQRLRLFAPFEQAEQSTSRKYGGTGLGLSICQHLVGLMGGQIQVSSQPGLGTRFEFSLWLARQSVEPPSQPVTLPALSIFNCSQAMKAYLQRLLPQAEFHALTANPAPVDASQWILYDSMEIEQDWPLICAHAQRHPHQPKLLICPLDRKEQIAQGQALFQRILYKPLRSSQLFDWLQQKQPSQTRLIAGLILLIEDEPLNQMLIREYLKALPVQLQLASSGQEARARYAEQMPDLILLDLHLPDVDGLSLLTELQRQSNPLPPVLVMTASTDPAEHRACRSQGVQDILTKPLNKNDLLNQLALWLNRETLP